MQKYCITWSYYHSHPLEIKKLYPPLSPIGLHLLSNSVLYLKHNGGENIPWLSVSLLPQLHASRWFGFSLSFFSVIDHGCFTVSSKTIERWKFKVARHTHISLFSRDAIEKIAFKKTGKKNLTHLNIYFLSCSITKSGRTVLCVCFCLQSLFCQ